MKLRYILGLFFCVVLYSCDYVRSIDKTGEQDTVYLQLSAVKSLELKVPIEVVLSNEATEATVLTGMDFIVDGYIFTEADGKLTITHTNVNNIQKEKMGKIVIPASSLSSIVLNSPSVVTTGDKEFKTELLNIIVNGSGIYSETDLWLDVNQLNLSVYGGINQSNHRLKGSVNSANYFIEGFTSIESGDLTCEQITITHRSNSDCYLRSVGSLNAIIYSTGSVYYSGNPQVTVERRETSLMKASGRVEPDVVEP